MQKRFITLCYHYIRPDEDDPFPRILGTRRSDFVNHISYLKKEYYIEEPDKILNLDSDVNSSSKIGILFTFDDGLSDQFEAGKMLSDEGIRAIFFIPSCIIQDKLPANPIIIHYSLALYGLDKFISKYNKAIVNATLDKNLLIKKLNVDNDFEIISKIKRNFYYEMRSDVARTILLKMYEDLSDDFGLELKDMHLSRQQILKLLEMGHRIGSHSHNHVSMLNPFLDSKECKNEFIDPKYTLETSFGTKVESMSYTYGDISDFRKYNFTNPFKLIFSVEPRINNEQTPKTLMGRYEVHSKDTVDKLKSILKNMSEGNEINNIS